MFLENAPLQARNTFAIAAKSRFLAEVTTSAQLVDLLHTVTAKNHLF
jgi:UDP-N-acetylenolpyruvoylglucosamine reductase